jgi:CRISPR-associated protein Csm4
MIVYRLAPTAPFHFGERGVGQEETGEFPHSDTLFASLVIAWRLAKGETEMQKLLHPLVSAGATGTNPPFRISSAFPYVGPVHLLPRPLIPLYGEDQAQQMDPKMGKKVEWVSWRRMESIINSNTPPRVLAGDLLMGGRVWIHSADRAELAESPVFSSRVEDLKMWSSGQAETIPRVTVDRINSSSALYFQGQVRFAEGCGLYVLVEFDQTSQDPYHQSVADGLALLGQLGLGGRRSVGLGQFEVQEVPVESLEQPVGDDDAYHLLLSLYHPTQTEMQNGVLRGARYRLMTRRGWFFSMADTGQRRRAVRMLTEGSMLACPATGDIVDVAPSAYTKDHHPVYRSGLALTIRSRRWPYV